MVTSVNFHGNRSKTKLTELGNPNEVHNTQLEMDIYVVMATPVK